MGNVKISLVTDPNWGAQAAYLDDRFIIGSDTDTMDTGGKFWTEALIEILSQPEFDGIEVEEISRMQPERKISGYFDWPDEYEVYWPESISKLINEDTMTEGADELVLVTEGENLDEF